MRFHVYIFKKKKKSLVTLYIKDFLPYTDKNENFTHFERLISHDEKEKTSHRKRECVEQCFGNNKIKF